MTLKRTMLAGAAAMLMAGPALAGPYTAEYVFGDSLSDRGNLADALGHHFPAPPFFHDSFTNGPVAVQVLANKLGLSADPSLFPTGFVDTHGLGYTSGTNYAVAGATAGSVGSEGVAGANLANQIGAYLLRSGNTTDPNALYTVFIGGNDVRTAAHQGDATLVTSGVQAELAGIQALIARGAKNLLVVNVPDIGVIPEFTLGFPTQVADATAETKQYNALLGAGVSQLAAVNPGASLKLFDLFSFNANEIANAGALGITNTTQPCYVSYGGVTNNNPLVINPACGAIDPQTGQAANIGQFQFWDPIHPTAQVHAAFGQALYDFVVPEPASFAVLGMGLAGIAGLRRRRRA